MLVLTCRFLPAKCPAHLTCVEIDADCGEAAETSSEQASKKQKDRKLDFGFWQVAWQKYSLAAIATGQLTMAQCQRHATVVLDVASLAGSQGRSAWLGVLYDEIAR